MTLIEIIQQFYSNSFMQLFKIQINREQNKTIGNTKHLNRSELLVVFSFSFHLKQTITCLKQILIYDLLIKMHKPKNKSQ